MREHNSITHVVLCLAVMKYFGLANADLYRATVITVLRTDFGIGFAYREELMRRLCSLEMRDMTKF